LGFAFTVYSMLIWTGLDLLAKPLQITAGQQAAALKLRPYAYLATALIGTTVASGAFVAGNDAGHAYNDWPFMAGKFIPEQIWDEKLGASNIFENTATVQFDHRMLAYATLGAVGGLHMAAKRFGGMRNFSPGIRGSLIALGGLVGAQIVLGVSTLMLYVPVPLAAAHQGGALALLTGAIALLHHVQRATRANPAVAPPAKAAAAVAAFAGAMQLRPTEQSY
jgi:cytochrome c oxidase assembly protein subunit 15